jgi:hypothetical protein
VLATHASSWDTFGASLSYMCVVVPYLFEWRAPDLVVELGHQRLQRKVLAANTHTPDRHTQRETGTRAVIITTASSITTMTGISIGYCSRHTTTPTSHPHHDPDPSPARLSLILSTCVVCPP